MRLTETLVASIARRTAWSEGHVFAIVPEQIGLAEGLRAALAIGVMLAATLLLAVPGLAWSAIAAFWICLADPVGSRPARGRTLLFFTGLGMAALVIASYSAHCGAVAGGAAMFVLVLLCGLARSYPLTFGPAAPQPGLIASLAVVIGVATPRSLPGALALGGYFLLGAAWAMLLCLYLWPIRSSTPARRALVAVFSRLGDMVNSLAALDAAPGDAAEAWTRYDSLDRRATRIALERTLQIVARADAGRGNFTRGVNAATDVFAALIALGRLRTTGQRFDPVTERPLLADLERLLRLAASQPILDRAMLRAEAEHLLQKARSQSRDFALAMQFSSSALVSMAQDAPAPEPASAAPASAGPAPARWWPLAVPQPVWRHAVRVATAVLAAYALGHWLDVTFSYWGSIATIVVMQPLMANTWLRVLERALGSLAGGLIAATLLALGPSPAHIAVAVVLLTGATLALRLVSYGFFIVFLTPMFMLLSDFIHPAGGLISARVINETIGAVVGLVACLALWPERQKRTLMDAVAAAVTANMAYVAGLLRAGSDADGALERLHRDAGLTSSRAETARERLLFEGRARAARLDQVGAILLRVRALCGAAIVLRITRAQPPHPDAARADACAVLAQQLQARLHGAPVDVPVPRQARHDGGRDDLDHAIDALALAVDRYAQAGPPSSIIAD